MVKASRHLIHKSGKINSFLKIDRKDNKIKKQKQRDSSVAIHKATNDLLQHSCCIGNCFNNLFKDYFCQSNVDETAHDMSFMSPYYVKAAKFVAECRNEMKLMNKSESMEFVTEEFKKSVDGKDSRGRFIHKWRIGDKVNTVCTVVWSRLYGISVSTIDRCARIIHQDGKANTMDRKKWKDKHIMPFTYGETAIMIAENCVNGRDFQIGKYIQYYIDLVVIDSF